MSTWPCQTQGAAYLQVRLIRRCLWYVVCAINVLRLTSEIFYSTMVAQIMDRVNFRKMSSTWTRGMLKSKFYYKVNQLHNYAAKRLHYAAKRLIHWNLSLRAFAWYDPRISALAKEKFCGSAKHERCHSGGWNRLIFAKLSQTMEITAVNACQWNRINLKHHQFEQNAGIFRHSRFRYGQTSLFLSSTISRFLQKLSSGEPN